MKCSSIVFVAVAAAALLTADASAASPAKDDMIPLIEMDRVPLADAIRQLARRAQLNILLDPRLSEPPFRAVTVSIRWQDVSAKEALVALLDNHGLVLVESSRPSLIGT